MPIVRAYGDRRALIDKPFSAASPHPIIRVCSGESPLALMKFQAFCASARAETHSAEH